MPEGPDHPHSTLHYISTLATSCLGQIRMRQSSSASRSPCTNPATLTYPFQMIRLGSPAHSFPLSTRRSLSSRSAHSARRQNAIQHHAQPFQLGFLPLPWRQSHRVSRDDPLALLAPSRPATSSLDRLFFDLLDKVRSRRSLTRLLSAGAMVVHLAQERVVQHFVGELELQERVRCVLSC